MKSPQQSSYTSEDVENMKLTVDSKEMKKNFCISPFNKEKIG